MFDFKKIKTAMILAPHTDDGELGCGATIRKMLDSGIRVIYVAFSICRESVPKGFHELVLKEELCASMDHYGIPSEDVIILDYPVRVFQSHRQEILEDMVKLNKQFSPDLVFAPALDDVHQDHNTIALECARAFKHTRILGYELPWNTYAFRNQCFSIVNKDHLNAKVESLACYKTQKNRIYFQDRYIEALLLTRGVQAGKEYAEVFELVRWFI